MAVTRSKELPIRCDADIVYVRTAVREWAGDLRLGLVDQTKLVTAASELARNALVYGGGGEVMLEELEDFDRHGVRLIFADRGPGIPDIELALRDGYTSGSGLGMGLGGARRLVDDFEIFSRVGEGTRVSITKWR